MSPVEPSFVTDVLAQVAADLHVSVTVAAGLLTNVGLGGILAL